MENNDNITRPSDPVNSVSIASRVVPLIGLTIVLSSPTNAFKILLFPTFGRPTMAIDGMYSPSSFDSVFCEGQPIYDLMLHIVFMGNSLVGST